jgi:Anti-sigma factor NepR
MASRARRVPLGKGPPGLFSLTAREKEDGPGPAISGIRTMYAQRSEKHVVELGPDIKANIGRQLRLMYGEVVDQGVPDRFVQMLKRLDDSNCEGK